MRNLYIDMEYSNFFSYDKSKSGEPLQIAIITEDTEFSQYCMPLNYAIWSEKSEKVHGISKMKSKQFSHPMIASINLKKFLESLKDIHTAVGFNCSGDKGILQHFLHHWGIKKEWDKKIREDWIDLRGMTGHLKLKDHKLSTICKHFNIVEQFHNAAGDARATMKLHKHLLAEKPLPQQESMDFYDKYEKRLQYLSADYCSISKEGFINITPLATKNKEAMKFILDEIAELFYLN